MKKILLFGTLFLLLLVNSAYGDRPGFQNGNVTAFQAHISAIYDSARVILEADNTTNEWHVSVNRDGFSIKEHGTGIAIAIQNGVNDSTLIIYGRGLVRFNEDVTIDDSLYVRFIENTIGASIDTLYGMVASLSSDIYSTDGHFTNSVYVGDSLTTNSINSADFIISATDIYSQSYHASNSVYVADSTTTNSLNATVHVTAGMDIYSTDGHYSNSVSVADSIYSTYILNVTGISSDTIYARIISATEDIYSTDFHATTDGTFGDDVSVGDILSVADTSHTNIIENTGYISATTDLFSDDVHATDDGSFGDDVTIGSTLAVTDTSYLSVVNASGHITSTQDGFFDDIHATGDGEIDDDFLIGDILTVVDTTYSSVIQSTGHITTTQDIFADDIHGSGDGAIDDDLTVGSTLSVTDTTYLAVVMATGHITTTADGFFDNLHVSGSISSVADGYFNNVHATNSISADDSVYSVYMFNTTGLSSDTMYVRIISATEDIYGNDGHYTNSISVGDSIYSVYVLNTVGLSSDTIYATVISNSQDIYSNTINTTGNAMIGNSLTVTSTSTFGDDLIIDNTGTDVDSPPVSLRGDDGGVEEEGSIYLVNGADPYLRFSVDDDNTSPALTPVFDLHDNVIAFTTDNQVDIGAAADNRPKNIYASGTIEKASETVATLQDVADSAFAHLSDFGDSLYAGTITDFADSAQAATKRVLNDSLYYHRSEFVADVGDSAIAGARRVANDSLWYHRSEFVADVGDSSMAGARRVLNDSSFAHLLDFADSLLAQNISDFADSARASAQRMANDSLWAHSVGDMMATDVADSIAAYNARGAIDIGTNDSVPGRIDLRGGGTTEDDAVIYLYNNSDNDGTDDWWKLRPYQTTFIIGSATNTDAITFTTAGGLELESDLSVVGTITTDRIDYDNTGLIDDAYSGETLSLKLTADVTQWDIIHISKTGSYNLTDADNTNTSTGMVVMATEAGSAGTTITVLKEGTVRNNGWEWELSEATSEQLYISDDTSGGMTQNLETLTDDGDVRRIVGYVLGADYIYFDPEKSWVVYIP